jgi:catechol 2,3-dioxygenase-like lactoylglutathione lyase family enzyme
VARVEDPGADGALAPVGRAGKEELLSVPRIQHVTITVADSADLPSVERFYSILGGIPLVRPERLQQDTPGAWLGFGDTQLHLVLGTPVEEPAHFALDLGGDTEYDRVLEALRGEGFSSRTSRDLWGARRSVVYDPAGNRVELFGVAPPSIPEDAASGE